MQSILSSFAILEGNQQEFNDLLKETGAVVAGSAPLAALVGGFTPGDLDIWVYPGPCESHENRFTSDVYENMRVVLGKFHDFLSNRGYTVNRTIAGTYKQVEEDGYSEVNTPMYQIIRKIDRYFHASNTKIQVIVTLKPILEVLNSFDISVCRTWWDGEKLYTWDHNTTLLRGMYACRPLATEREYKRFQKYKDRGFTVYEVPDYSSLVHPEFNKMPARFSPEGHPSLTKVPEVSKPQPPGSHSVALVAT